MANECCNYITLTGEPELIKLVAKDYVGYNKETNEVHFDFNLIAPIPQDILEANLDYQWRINNWGNKWDGTNAYVDLDDEQIFISVETAWSPCDKITYKLIELCPGLDIYHEYYEPGEGYIGYIKHNCGDDPGDFEDIFYNYSHEPLEYWTMVFDKEYESFEWLCEMIDERLDEEIISQEVHDELLNLIDNNIPLESLIVRCLNEEVL